MGKFQPGQSGNPAGRPRGSGIPKTKDLRQKLKELISIELDGLPELLSQLEPKDRAAMIVQLARFVLPRVGDLTAGAVVDEEDPTGSEMFAKLDQFGSKAV
jgi:hypothetical protein